MFTDIFPCWNVFLLLNPRVTVSEKSNWPIFHHFWSLLGFGRYNRVFYERELLETKKDPVSDVVTTMLTSKQRCINVKTTPCAYWGLLTVTIVLAILFLKFTHNFPLIKSITCKKIKRNR